MYGCIYPGYMQPLPVNSLFIVILSMLFTFTSDLECEKGAI